MTKTKIMIAGCGGAMGRAILASAFERGFSVVGGFDRKGDKAVGADLGVLAGEGPLGVTAGDTLKGKLAKDTVLVDFTAPMPAVDHARTAAEAGAAMVIGATGFHPEQDDQIRQLAEKIAIVKSGNMSLGVNLLCALVEQAASALPDRYDIEIVEAHHRRKVDAPSGTALMLGEAAASGRNVGLDEKSVRTRDGITDPRKAGDIGFAVIRGGGIVGDHEVLFAGDKEVLTLSHQAIDRALFAEGALAAAKWVNGKPPGLYSMRDVLGLK